MFELERIVLMPQASKSLAALMTTLLRWVTERMLVFKFITMI